MNTDRRRDVDLLIEEFWKKGYLTLSRKFGTYLPEPSAIGGFDVDVVAKQKDSFAIGISLLEDDFRDYDKIKNKLTYLAQRQVKGSNKKVTLFVGVSLPNFKFAKQIIEELDPEIKKNIKLVQIVEKPTIISSRKSSFESALFS